jgi:hypothetical protein
MENFIYAILFVISNGLFFNTDIPNNSNNKPQITVQQNSNSDTGMNDTGGDDDDTDDDDQEPPRG